MKVRSLKIRQIFATNSQKTIEVDLETEKGRVRSSVPVGTSRSKYEVQPLPIENTSIKFNLIRRHFTAQIFSDQKEIDYTLHLIDKSPNFREIGGNIALAISSAFLKAFALDNSKEVFEYLSEKPSIPKPLCNVVGGWKGQSDIQEFILLPVHQKSFMDSITKISSAYYKLGSMLKQEDSSFNFGKNIESAWVTNLPFEKILKILSKVATDQLLKIGLDVAASQLWDGNKYVYSTGKKLTQTEQMILMQDLARRYPIIYIEDPFHEDDFILFSTLTSIFQQKLVCGDDLFATNLDRLKIGIGNKATRAIVIKPNQAGTITDMINVVEEAKKNKLITVMSHRSGETEDTLICHLAAGLNCDYIKLGISGERTSKINEMIRIEEKFKL